MKSMDKDSVNYDIQDFEGEGFVKEYLNEFEANVAKNRR